MLVCLFTRFVLVFCVLDFVACGLLFAGDALWVLCLFCCLRFGVWCVVLWFEVCFSLLIVVI